MRDALGPLYTNPTFAALFSHTGRPAEAPAQLALITVMQFAEGLSDAQAAEAVRARIDWKYTLALELSDPGFDASVLSEFRQRLITGHAELLLFVIQVGDSLPRLRTDQPAQPDGRPKDELGVAGLVAARA